MNEIKLSRNLRKNCDKESVYVKKTRTKNVHKKQTLFLTEGAYLYSVNFRFIHVVPRLIFTITDTHTDTLKSRSKI